jgi:hypothetical protein
MKAAREGNLWLCPDGHALEDCRAETRRWAADDRWEYETDYYCLGLKPGKTLCREGCWCDACDYARCGRPVHQVDRLKLAFARAAGRAQGEALAGGGHGAV